MIKQQLYQNIYKRKSVRRYDMTPLSESVLDEIKAFAASAVPLVEAINYEFTYLSAGDVKNLLPIKAPHYICLYSETKPNSLMNAGYLLQQMDLYLSHKSLGSCWLGMAKPNKEIALNRNGLEFVIMLAFGASNEPVHRAQPDEFKRKLTHEMSSLTELDAIVEAVTEAVRLAPSASNSQPWFISGTPDSIVVSREKLSMLRGALYGKMNQIDIGIALLHLDMAVRQQGRQVRFSFAPLEVPQGYEFMAKVETKAIDE